MRTTLVRASILATALAGTHGALAAPPVPLTEDGLGPVRMGMTVRQVEQLIGPLDISYYESGPDCGQGGPKRPWIPGVSLMFVKGRLARIDIWVPNDVARSEVTTKTEAGVGVGSTIAEVKKAYGARLKIEPRPYEEENEHDLIVDDARRGRKIILETESGLIDTFRAGLSGPVDYIEGCS